jgi:hypothetical protein
MLLALLLAGAPPGSSGENDGVERDKAAETSKGVVSNVAYDVGLSATGEALVVKGELTEGVANAFEAALANAPNAKRVDLDSIGGLIVEAERIAEAIRGRELDTNVTGVCFSACTHVLLGGVHRTAPRRNSVGFHRPYTLDDEEEAPDPDAPYAAIIARSFYEKAKLPPAFIARIFATPIAAMWKPSRRELLEAGVLTAAPVR